MRAKRRQRKALKNVLKKTLMVLGGLLLLVIVGVIGVLHYVIDEEFLERKIESSIQSDASIGKVTVSLFGAPATITLNDVELSGKPGNLRSRNALVQVKKVELNVNLWSLLHRHINVSKMVVQGAHVTGTVYQDGGSSLEALFDSIDTQQRDSRFGSTTKSPSASPSHGPDSADSSEVKKNAGGGFNVFDQEGFVTSLGGFFLEDSTADLTFEKTGLRVQCSDINLALDALKIDPKRLMDTDMAKLKMSVKVRLDSTKGWHYGDLNIEGSAAARIFNPETGDMEPELEGSFDLSDDSWLNTQIPVIAEVWGQLGQFEKLGIQIANLPERATFGRSKAVAAHYHLGKITVKKPISLWVSDWELAVIEGSWLQTDSNQHMIDAELLASRVVSAKFYGLITLTIDYLLGEAKDTITKNMKGSLFRGERFLVRVKSSEELSNPKIRLVDGIPDFGKAAEEECRKLLEEKADSFLKGFFDS